MLERSKLEALIFDGEGVVIDTEPLWDEAQRRLLERRGIQYDRARVKHLLAGKSAAEGVAILQREFQIKGDSAALAAEREAEVRALMAKNVRLVPGFEDFFERIRGRYKTCIATSMTRDLIALADVRLHLSTLFGDRIFSIADVGNRSKPDPALFLYAAKKLGAPPSRCVVIEDSPNGIEAASRANMYCVGLATTFPGEVLTGANEIAFSFEDLWRLLAPVEAVA